MALKEIESEVRARKLLPAIEKVQAELHAALDVLAAAASHAAIRAEASYRDVRTADLSARIARNRERYLAEGTTPLAERFVQSMGKIRQA